MMTTGITDPLAFPAVPGALYGAGTQKRARLAGSKRPFVAREALLAAACASTLAFTLGVPVDARPRSPHASYTQMAAVDQYITRAPAAEIALARSAAPEEISQKATILVLGRNGYRIATKGTNGFTCLVERSWMSPFDSPEFWNPKILGPICYNPAAARTVLRYTIYRTKLVLTGSSKPRMHRSIEAKSASDELPTPGPGAMSFMMSKQGYLGDAVGHWCPHLMFHVPKTSAAAFGANADGSPVIVNDAFRDVPEPETILMVPVSHWSDGTPRAKM